MDGRPKGMEYFQQIGICGIDILQPGQLIERIPGYEAFPCRGFCLYREMYARHG